MRYASSRHCVHRCCLSPQKDPWTMVSVLVYRCVDLSSPDKRHVHRCTCMHVYTHINTLKHTCASHTKYNPVLRYKNILAAGVLIVLLNAICQLDLHRAGQNCSCQRALRDRTWRSSYKKYQHLKLCIHNFGHCQPHWLLAGLSEYPVLMALLRQRTHKDLATRIVQTVLRKNTRIEDAAKTAALFRCVCPCFPA